MAESGFASLGLSANIIRACKLLGYNHPHRIQQEAIPAILAGRDVVVRTPPCSTTALCFLAPLLHSLNQQQQQQGCISSIRALILTPTKRVAHQIIKLLPLLVQFTGLRIGSLVGDDNMENLFEDLTLQNPDVMIATPDNLKRHLSHVKDMLLHNVECIVLYEADCLFGINSAKHVRQILSHINQNHQTLLFVNDNSSRPPVKYVKYVTQDPHFVFHEPRMCSMSRHIFFALSEKEKYAALLYLVLERVPRNERTLLFVPSRHHTELLQFMLKDQGMEPSICYGRMDPNERRLQLSRFETGKTMLMIITDFAFSVTVIPWVDNIINWDFPCDIVDYRSRLRVNRLSGRIFCFVTRDAIPVVLNFRNFLLEQLMAAPSEEQIMQDGNAGEVISEIDQANLSPGEFLYGSLPPTKVDFYADMVCKLVAASPELQSTERLCARATAQVLAKLKLGLEHF